MRRREYGRKKETYHGAAAAQCATTASCALSGGGSSVGTDLNGGELCALCAEEGREARERRVSAKEGERLPRSPYLFTAEEIVGA